MKTTFFFVAEDFCAAVALGPADVCQSSFELPLTVDDLGIADVVSAVPALCWQFRIVLILSRGFLSTQYLHNI